MRDHLTQKELDQEFYGTPPVVIVKFYDKEILNVSESKASGKRVMKKQVYIALDCAKENAHANRPASDQDKQRHRGAWMKYEQEKENGRIRQVSEDESENRGGEDCAYISAA